VFKDLPGMRFAISLVKVSSAEESNGPLHPAHVLCFELHNKPRLVHCERCTSGRPRANAFRGCAFGFLNQTYFLRE